MILDWRLPDCSGGDAARAIGKEFPDVRIVVLSAFDGEEDVYRAIEAGADAYLSKNAARKEIVKAMRAVHRGESYFPLAIASKAAARMRRDPLSQRELEVLAEIVKGRSNKEIADVLGITCGTVKLHVVNLLSKLEVRDRTQAASVAIQRGIIRLD